MVENLRRHKRSFEINEHIPLQNSKRLCQRQSDENHVQHIATTRSNYHLANPTNPTPDWTGSRRGSYCFLCLCGTGGHLQHLNMI
ncbi:hypothetical protein TrispH2_001235 [Trichoplax sp. H2]|nr:hypothetical protein TrispH2_001235 [Trichoplax sp. H2]|eukprot:RDD46405.1 hypothetical protein TrispH2_001235 [Trichoplax sp. H2]